MNPSNLNRVLTPIFALCCHK